MLPVDTPLRLSNELPTSSFSFGTHFILALVFLHPQYHPHRRHLNSRVSERSTRARPIQFKFPWYERSLRLCSPSSCIAKPPILHLEKQTMNRNILFSQFRYRFPLFRSSPNQCLSDRLYLSDDPSISVGFGFNNSGEVQGAMKTFHVHCFPNRNAFPYLMTRRITKFPI